MKNKTLIIILLALFCVIFTGFRFNSEETTIHVGVNEDSADSLAGISYSLNTFPDNEYDNYATIDSYDNAKNVINGVFTIPTEITYKGITYPVMGVNGVYSSETIKEVIVPKDFGSKKLNLPTEYTSPAGNGSFITLPNVPKVTIYAEDINIVDLFIDGSHILMQNGRRFLTWNKLELQEVNIYSKKVRIKEFAITDYPNLENISFAKDTQLIMDKYAIVNLPKLNKLDLPAHTKFTEGAISYCSNLKELTFQEESSYYVNPENGGVLSPSNTLLFVPSDTETYTTSDHTNKIGDLAFTCCKNLKKVNSNAKIIGEYAFMDCKNLTKINLTNHTQKIENFAFSNCNLSSFQLPPSVTSIGHGILNRNENLSIIKVEGSHYKCINGALTTRSGKTLLAMIPVNGKVIVPNGVVTMRSAPITAPLKVVSLSFPSSLCNFYQMGQKMKNLKQVTFKGEVVPNDLEINPKFEDLVNLCNIGYNQSHIWVDYSQKVIFDIPSKNKKAYRIFIKHICPASSHVFIQLTINEKVLAFAQ